MATRTTNTNQTTELAKRQEAIQAAAAEVERLRQERRESQRRLEAAQASLSDYWERIGAGDAQPDPDREAELEAELRDLKAVAAIRAQRVEGRVTSVEFVDSRIEARLAGAERALEDRRRDLHEFLKDNGELVREWIAEASAVRARVEKAWSELAEPLRQWHEIAVRWGPLLAANDITTPEIPPHPLTGLERDPALDGVALPVPASLVADGET